MNNIQKKTKRKDLKKKETTVHETVRSDRMRWVHTLNVDTVIKRKVDQRNEPLCLVITLLSAIINNKQDTLGEQRSLGEVLISFPKAMSPYVVIPLLSVTHGQCDARPYLPSRKASPSIGWYQIILLGDRGTCVLTTCPGLHSTAERPVFEPATCWSQVQHPNHSATKNGLIMIHDDIWWYCTNLPFPMARPQTLEYTYPAAWCKFIACNK